MGVPGQNRTDCMHGRKNREGGFTLIEIMIAVAIVGIMSVLAVPNFREWLARYDLKQSMSEIAGDMSLAKLVAMNRNRQATVTIQMAGSLVQVSGISGGQEIFNTQTLPSRVNALPGGAATVNFSSMGLSTVTAAQTIQIQNDQGLIYSLSVLPSGKVTWCAKASCP
jgi:type IV fimbrial biogenesis protein FimT